MRYIIYECCYFFGGNVRKCVRSSREFTILPGDSNWLECWLDRWRWCFPSFHDCSRMKFVATGCSFVITKGYPRIDFVMNA